MPNGAVSHWGTTKIGLWARSYNVMTCFYMREREFES